MVVFRAGVVGCCRVLRQLMFESALRLTIFETVVVRNEPLLSFNRCDPAINYNSRTNRLDFPW